MPDFLLHLVRDICGKLADIVVILFTGEFRQRVDQVSGLFYLGETAAAGQALLAVVAAGCLAFAGIESAQAGLPSVSKISSVVSPSMSVISAALSLPLSW